MVVGAFVLHWVNLGSIPLSNHIEVLTISTKGIVWRKKPVSFVVCGGIKTLLNFNVFWYISK